jgi:pSer/pThr/pTyr-binding forkhead associated (FHA) protein
MTDRTMELSAGGVRSSSPAPLPHNVHATRVCGRCMAGNSTGETFCKVCGDELPAPTEATLPIDLATRRIVPPSLTAQLIIHEDGVGSAGGTASLNKDVNLIGRASPHDRVFPEVDLTSADPDTYVSRRHAFILRRHDGFALEDLESANGTYVNGTTRILPHAVAVLKDGDIVTFGRTRCTFRVVPATTQ